MGGTSSVRGLAGDIRLIAAASVLVVLLIYRLPALVSPLWCVPLLAVCLWRFPGRTLLATLGLMAAWTLTDAQWRMADRLPIARDGTVTQVRGHVVTLPEVAPTRTRFRVAGDNGRRYRLSWYRDAPALQAGDCIAVRAKLSTPHGSANPGGFDYTAWLWREGIDATGYVKQDLGCRGPPIHSLDRLRGAALARIAPALEASPMRGIVEALSLGVRQHIDDDQWAVLRATGTSHLVAISGLHIGLIAGLLFLVARWLALRSPARFHARVIACGMAFVGACGYAGLAGWALPTQRALVMVSVGLVAIALEREIGASRALAAAALAVIVVAPPSVTAPGFWLSFGAVAWLIVLAGWIRGPWWVRWIGYQLGLVAALAPITLWFFGQASLIAPLINGLLIPAASVVVPAVLLAVLSAIIAPDPGGLVLAGVAQGLDFGWQRLAWAAHFELAALASVLASIMVLVLAMTGAAWLALPLPARLRALGLCLLLPLVLSVRPSTPPPKVGAFTVDVLDVGQGLSTLVRTATHTLVFDAGPAYRSGFDAGAMIVAPYLSYMGVRRIDILMISHGDMDHIGGAAALAERFPIGRRLGAESARPCRAGTAWRWDEVSFHVLAPTPGDSTSDGNDASCVLRVSADDGSVLLTGDIEHDAERRLVAARPTRMLASDVLIVPHHGSATSSSGVLLDAVAPRAAVVSSGWHNRWGFPRPSVVARYATRDIRLYNTATAGRIRVAWVSGVLAIRRWRSQAPRFWHTP